MPLPITLVLEIYAVYKEGSITTERRARSEKHWTWVRFMKHIEKKREVGLDDEATLDQEQVFIQEEQRAAQRDASHNHNKSPTTQGLCSLTKSGETMSPRAWCTTDRPT